MTAPAFTPPGLSPPINPATSTTTILPGRPKRYLTGKQKFFIIAVLSAIGLALIFIPASMERQKKEKPIEVMPRVATGTFPMKEETTPAAATEQPWPEPKLDFRMPDAAPNTSTTTTSNPGRAWGVFAANRTGGSNATTAAAPTRLDPSDDDDPRSSPRPGREQYATAVKASIDDGAIKAKRYAPDSIILPGDIEIPCTVKPATDSQLQGPVRCDTDEPVLGLYGGVGPAIEVLPKGTRIKGGIISDLKRGQNRSKIVWFRARTPDGVTVKLNNALAGDELGRVGVDGEVDRHLVERYGGALMYSLIMGAPQMASAYLSGLGSNGFGGNSYAFIGPQQQVAGSYPQELMNIPNTIKTNQGIRITILLDDDLDFSAVYKLRMKHVSG